MIEGVTSANQYIYHYTPCAKPTLQSRTLKFGMYIRTNDPKESKDWEFDLGTNENADIGRYDMQALGAWLSAQLKANARAACFSLDTPPLSGNHLSDIFKRGFCKPRMWAQYAARHTGACLVFDFQKLHWLVEEQFPSPFLVIGGPMQYVDRDVIRRMDETAYTINIDYLERMGKTEYVKWHLLAYYKRLFFEKMTDWRDEREFRWMIFGSQTDDLYVKFEDALVGIVFGEESDESEVSEIMKMTSDMSIHYTGLKWKNCSPWYDFGNLKYLGLKS
jgi:Protein of unknown function (DUF2971)